MVSPTSILAIASARSPFNNVVSEGCSDPSPSSLARDSSASAPARIAFKCPSSPLLTRDKELAILFKRAPSPLVSVEDDDSSLDNALNAIAASLASLFLSSSFLECCNFNKRAFASE